jgi:hypothetical protein
VARVLRRHFRATRRLHNFAAIVSFEVADLATICCGLSRYHFGNLVCCDVFLLLSSSCFFFLIFCLKSCFCFVWGSFRANCVPRFSSVWFRKTQKTTSWSAFFQFASSSNMLPALEMRTDAALCCWFNSVVFLAKREEKSREVKRSHFASR